MARFRHFHSILLHAGLISFVLLCGSVMRGNVYRRQSTKRAALVGDGMRRPVSRRDALGSQLVTHSKCKRRPVMRKDTSRNKQQIRSKKERETREGFEFYM